MGSYLFAGLLIAKLTFCVPCVAKPGKEGEVASCDQRFSR